MKKRLSLQDKAELAMKEAVRKVVERHKKTGRPLAVWENGKVRHISAAEALRRRRCSGGKANSVGTD
ncbi:MAG: hypothetical protein A3G91_04400 [Omnitrophica WOR_2 bacterium RIFCSPLOWO2_12_FULL_50_9]|nr:MAG: hypothetical protein A3D87_05705 [Omnitrophica WOR_2 bacterium RIFCSPHIGHO2_02_FULL_50_17]OGX43479.1 MAG: hypothetical protein A3G91_04400 [Omnitrophica WOR_2 bacterium RIFCSPLOWO2_12_FULL_50_9]